CLHPDPPEDPASRCPRLNRARLLDIALPASDPAGSVAPDWRPGCSGTRSFRTLAEENGMEKQSSSTTVRPHTGGLRSEVDSGRGEGERREWLVERLAEEMAAAWGQGGRPLVEDYMARHPELGDNPALAARLIYEEICLREDLGQRSPWDEVI